MAATYDPTLASDEDHVRILIGDNGDGTTQAVITNPRWTDEEITAVIAKEGNAHLAAAELLRIDLTRWAGAGRGVVEKHVGKLKIKQGIMADFGAVDALKEHINYLRRIGGDKLLAGSSGPPQLKMI